MIYWLAAKLLQPGPINKGYQAINRHTACHGYEIAS